MQPHRIEESAMKTRLPIVLIALLAFAQSFFLLPAAADSGTPAGEFAAVRQNTAAPSACPANLEGLTLSQVVQLDCCKGHKGICGCRAGKIVCCDNTTSTEPGCTCHGDEAIAN
jgi:hypothetical protein